ncbi:MAG TPA: MBOAT family protein [Gemmatimonadaceae bacterium]|jgi:alginate O-acetyltransferase complex protein AlgI|nr:MBOAT family protein [Gemmatimonadaceae bacterium]
MLFNSFVFLLAFLPITYLVFWTLRSAKSRYVWLTITGYVFYGYWDPRFCLLMAFSTLVSFTAGLGFLRWTDGPHRRLLLILPITVDLLILGFFKYANFVFASIGKVLNWAGAGVSIPHWNIILPIGISFYTFHTITYIVDSYRGVIKPTRNLFEFSAYVSLFSQLVAGPIVRFRQIEEDLDKLGHADRARWLSLGISFFLIGLLEKVVIADTLAFFVDRELAQYQMLSTSGAWLAMIGYSFQLYFDFAGYSDMAIGLGYMFCIRIPINFNSPYKALDPSDFWRRWHISLSSCLRDYIYIPLGGNRHGELNAYRNLLLTMLIGGLWHGANWTFVIWGAYHGILLAAYRRFASAWDRLPRLLRQVGMFLLVLFGWVLFRSASFGMAADLFARMFRPTSGISVEGGLAYGVVLLIAGAWAMAGPNAQDIHAHWSLTPRRMIVLAAAAGASLAVMLGSGSSPFLYFQF